MQLVRPVLVLLTTLMLATPASAQFGGLKKKIKRATGQEDSKAAASTDAPTPAAQGGTIVLTAEVVNQLLTGLKAGQTERDAAAREDTPYGRYKKAEIAYAEAQPKCEAGKQAWIQKASADPKQIDKVNTLNQKMIDAQSKQDYKLMEIYQ